MGWVEDLKKVKRDPAEARRIYDELPTLARPKRGSSIAIIIPKRGMGEGGPGSGWFAPPKGTHSPGSQGGDPEKTRARKRKLYALNAAARVGVKMSVTECARIGYREKIEAAYCVLESGRRYQGIIKGDEDSVNVSMFQIAGDRAHVLVHNHPDATSFSEGDFRLMVNWSEVEHFVLVSGDGSLYRLSRTPDTIPEPRNLEEQGVFQAGLARVIEPIFDKYGDRRRLMGANKAWPLTIEEAAQEMAVYCRLEYEHIPPPPLRIGG